MTGPPPELLRARRWSADLVAALDELTRQVGATARRLADVWPDARGRECTDRLHVLRVALERDTDDASAFGRTADRIADDTGLPLDGPSYGPHLGGTGGRRADDRRGVTIPQLNDDQLNDPG